MYARLSVEQSTDYYKSCNYFFSKSLEEVGLGSQFKKHLHFSCEMALNLDLEVLSQMHTE